MDISNKVSNFNQPAPSTFTKQEPKADPIKVYQKEVERDSHISKKFSESEMKRMIADLNEEMSLISTDLRFGYNSQVEMLQVSIINKKTNEIIRRFPTEEAVSLMTTMKDFIGVIFDKEG